MRIRSLPFKINTAIFVTAAVIAIVFLVILFPVEKKRYARETDRIFLLLDTICKQKQNDLANEIFAQQQRALKATLTEIKAIREEIVNVCLYQDNGEKYLCYDNDAGHSIDSKVFADFRKEPVFYKSKAANYPLGTYLNSIEVIGATVGYIAIHYNLSQIEKEGRELFYVFFFLLLATTLVMSLLQNVFLFQAIIRPVSRLRNAMRRVEEGHLGETVRLPWRDEIGEMGAAFNDMSLQLLKSKGDIKNAERKYRDIFEQSIEGIFQALPDHSRFLTVNPSLAQILGFSTAGELLLSVDDIKTQLFLSREDWQRYEQDFEAVGRIVGFETQLLRTDSQTIWVSISCRRVFDVDGSHIYNEGSIVDITERRQRERAEREREAAEAANRAKSEFLAKMSHEIRTPLNAILGFAEILESGLEDQQRKNYAQIIKSGGQNLLQLINDILDLSKIEAGKMELYPTEVDVRQLLRQLAEVFSVQVKHKGISMRTMVDAGVPRYLMLDIVRLRQILFNIIGNAVKFTEQGVVEISVTVSETFPAAESVNLSIQISDSGVGIAPEARAEIFESFQQQHGNRHPATEGTGLGLTISKNLAEAMGGYIHLESEVGKGSVFTVHIPEVMRLTSLDMSNKDEYVQSDSRHILFGEATVLVADDLEINRKLLRAAFGDSPVQIVEAVDGSNALALAEEHRPELILMDIRMPNLDGHEAFREIRKIPALQKTPIIALTASGMPEDIELIRRTGFDDFLIRPFNIAELREKLVKYLNVEWGMSGVDSSLDERAGLPASCSYLVDWSCPAEVVRQLQEIQTTEWQKIRRNQRISDIRAFSEHILRIGRDRGLAVLLEYGRTLADFAATLDIDNIQQTLENFPEILSRIQN